MDCRLFDVSKSVKLVACFDRKGLLYCSWPFIAQSIDSVILRRSCGIRVGRLEYNSKFDRDELLRSVNEGRLCGKLKEVLNVILRVPEGKVATYLAVSKAVEVHQRVVGRLLSLNPYPVVYPCHRVVRSNGSLGGYSAGVHVKRALLEAEGVRLVNDKVATKNFIIFNLSTYST